LLSSNSSGSVGVFSLLMLRVCLSVLRWYICRDDQDLCDLGSRILLPDNSGRSLCERPGTRGGLETILGSTDGDEPW
jgi:hypothetical protein